jgi:GT2 family glycosyltransferase
MFNIALICTCFNRVKITRKSLNTITKALKNTKKINKFHFFILDDNSKDQTNKFLTNFKNTSVLKSKGNLYWARGMRVCFSYFYNDIIKYDILIPFNDDVILKKNNLNHLIDKYELLLKKKKLFLLSVPCKFNNKIIYGGQKFKYNSFLPIFKIVKPFKNKLLKIDVINMNFALIPMSIISKYKFLDNYFKHALADFAFSLKLRKFKIYSYLYSKPIIECRPNLRQSKKLEKIDLKPKEKFYKNYFMIYYYLWPVRTFFKKYFYETNKITKK